MKKLFLVFAVALYIFVISLSSCSKKYYTEKQFTGCENTTPITWSLVAKMIDDFFLLDISKRTMDIHGFQQAWQNQTVYANQDILFTAKTLSADGAFSIQEEMVKIYACTPAKVLQATYKKGELWLEVSFDTNAQSGSTLTFWALVSASCPEATLQIQPKFRFGDRVYELSKNKAHTLSVNLTNLNPDKKKLGGSEGGKEKETYQNE